MGNDALIHIALGGALAIMILREVFGFLKSQKVNINEKRNAGEQSIEFWQAEIRKAVFDSTAPFLDNQTMILKEIADTNKQINNGIIELVTIQRREK